jgi:NitT/TauT family transport system substrate-binding protein
MIRRLALCLGLAAASFVSACNSSQTPAQLTEIRIPRGAGGVGFLPLLMMEKFQLVEKHAREAGMPDLKVQWIELGGPSAMNDALLSGSVEFIAAGPPAFLILWDKTLTSTPVKGVAAMTSLPMYLNTTAPHLQKLDDVTEKDKIALTAIKVSIPAIVMQMYATQRYGASEMARFDKYTVSMTHPDGVIALLGGSGAINAHFTSPPFHQRERKDPKVRTIMNTDDVMGGSTTFTMLSTTSKFRDANPKAYAAVLSALEEANTMILADKKQAAEVLLGSTTESGFSLDEIFAVLDDPDIHFTTTPERVMKYAEFMKSVGTLQNLPASWQDLFFSEVHSKTGS